MDSTLETPIAGEEKDEVLWLLHDLPKLCVAHAKSKKPGASAVMVPLGEFVTPKAVEVKDSEWSGFWLIGRGVQVVIGMPSPRAREICLRCFEKVIAALNKLDSTKEDESRFAEQMEAVLFKPNPLLSMGSGGGNGGSMGSGGGNGGSMVIDDTPYQGKAPAKQKKTTGPKQSAVCAIS
jgi:hypothetical protein